MPGLNVHEMMKPGHAGKIKIDENRSFLIAYTKVDRIEENGVWE